MIYLDLTPEQKKEFTKLKKAYKKCESLGIRFINNYGSLEAYDKKLVEGYADGSTYNKYDDDVISSHNIQSLNSMNLAHEWGGGTHLLKLTKKGKKMIVDGNFTDDE